MECGVAGLVHALHTSASVLASAHAALQLEARSWDLRWWKDGMKNTVVNKWIDWSGGDGMDGVGWVKMEEWMGM